MGACSSKPKTTEFEGVIEPRKQTDVAADQPQETERNLENIADAHSKEGPSKVGGGGEGAHATSEAVQKTAEPDVGKDEGASKGALSRSAEGRSEEETDVLGEKGAAQEASDKNEQKESKVAGVSDVVPEDDVAVKFVPDQTSENIGSADVKVVPDQISVTDDTKTSADVKKLSVSDDAKTCEDKAVVSEEAGDSQGGYIDKTVPHDEEKAAETPDRRNIIVPEEEASTMLDSPITGVVQPVELMEATEGKNVSNNVSTVADIVSGQRGTQLADGTGDVGAGSIATEDGRKDSLAREAPTESIGSSRVEILAPTSAVETLPPISAVETLDPVEANPVKNVGEGTPQSQGETFSDALVDVSSVPLDSKEEVEECLPGAKVGVPLDERVVNQSDDSHATTVGNAGGLEMETSERAFSEIPTSDLKSEHAQEDLKTEGVQEESVKGKAMVQTDVRNGSSALASREDVGPTVSLGERHERQPEREEKDEQEQESTVEVGKETPDKPHLEHTISGDGTFEDASDVPLKLEAGKSIGSGQIPS
ncbi:hypothetical protein L7F22_017332 [Adiantum nelumboides]|nr:hypothetical protein [Adiantum nelumboides]